MNTNVILISIDNLRYDCVGYQRDKKELEKYDCLHLLNTTTLDLISEKSSVFTNAFSTNTYTTSAHASLFTGLYPPRHGVREFYYGRLNPKVKTLPEIFKLMGYKTIMATDGLELFGPLGLTRGFDFVIDRDDDKLFELLLKALQDERLFIFVHFFDVHEPYMFSECPPGEGYNEDFLDLMKELGRIMDLELDISKPHSTWRMVADSMGRNISVLLPIYINGVRKFDRGRFKRFVDVLKIWGYFDNSLVMILSDHGEGRCSFHNKDYFSHAGELYDNVLRIPMMMYSKDLAPSVRDNLMSIVDVAPTIFETLTVDVGEFLDYDMDGVPFGEGREYVYAEVWCSDKDYHLSNDDRVNPAVAFDGASWLLLQRAIRTEGKKFLLHGREETLLDEWIFNLPDEEFVRCLYRNILARFEDDRGFEHHLTLLERGMIDREKMIMGFLDSEEYRTRPRMAIIDVKADPYEDTPYPPRNLLDFVEYNRYLREILAIERCTLPPEPILIGALSEEEREKIEEKLQALGYI